MNNSLPASDLQKFKKHNNLIRMFQAKQNMTLTQQKFFDAVTTAVQILAKSGKLGDIKTEGDIEFDYKYIYSIMMEGSSSTKINRAEIKQAIEDITDIKFRWDVKEGDIDEVGAFVVFQKARLDLATGRINITFGKDFRVDWLLPTSEFTWLTHATLNNLKSSYARILYAYFKMLIGKDSSNPFCTHKVLGIEYLQDLLGIQADKHKTYAKNKGHFLRKCVFVARDEINEKTDILITRAEPIRKGRNGGISEVDFEFLPNPKKHVASIQAIEPMIANPAPTKQQMKIFKDKVVEDYKGRPIITGLSELGYAAVTTIMVNNEGLLEYKGRGTLKPEDAVRVWEWLFGNSHRIGDVRDVSVLEMLNYDMKGTMLRVAVEGPSGKDNMQIKIAELKETPAGSFKIMADNDGLLVALSVSGKSEFEEKELREIVAKLES